MRHVSIYIASITFLNQRAMCFEGLSYTVEIYESIDVMQNKNWIISIFLDYSKYQGRIILEMKYETLVTSYCCFRNFRDERKKSEFEKIFRLALDLYSSIKVEWIKIFENQLTSWQKVICMEFEDFGCLLWKIIFMCFYLKIMLLYVGCFVTTYCTDS